MADFLVALAEFDRQRLWLELGYPGLFMFLHRELGLSCGAAHFRKVAAELVQRFPEVVQPLRDGRLCITSVVELARVVTPENFTGVLPRFFHRSRREAKQVAAEICPAAVIPHREVTTVVPAAVAHAVTAVTVPGVVAPVPGAAPFLLVEMPAPLRDAPSAAPLPQTTVPLPAAGAPVSAAASTAATPLVAAAVPVAAAVTLAPPGSRAVTIEPLTAELSRFHVTVSRSFLDKLEKARSALSHSYRGAGAGEILEAGLDLILAAQEKRKGGANRPLAKPRPSKPGHIPASVKREVWKRDQGRCQWPIAGKAGGICGSTRQIEFDHVETRARGGPSTAEKIRLLCRVHNVLAARRVFGDRWMDRFTRRGRSGHGVEDRRLRSNPPRRNAGAPAG